MPKSAPYKGIKVCSFFIRSLSSGLCAKEDPQHVGIIKDLLQFAEMAISVVFVSEVFWRTPTPVFPYILDSKAKAVEFLRLLGLKHDLPLFYSQLSVLQFPRFLNLAVLNLSLWIVLKLGDFHGSVSVILRLN